MKSINLFKMVLVSFLIMLGSEAFCATNTSSDHNLATTAENFANKTVNLVKDSAITGYIYTQIALDKNLSNLKINVSTDKGVVTLEGTLNSDSEASSLIQLASSTAGVKSVDASKLQIRQSKQPFKDMVITAKIKGTFIRERLFDNKNMPADIHVETNNGVVYLSGTASNTAQAETAVNLAKSISGVTRVESTIKVVDLKR